MSSVVEIYNLALAAIGVTRQVAAVDEGSQEAATCTLHYANCRDRVLRDFDWPFARRYETLGLVAESPNTEWTYSYRYPSSCVNVRRLVGANRADHTRLFFVLGSDASGKLIYTDEPEAVAVITARIEDSEIFDPGFVNALAFLLASRVGGPLSRDAKLVTLAREQYIAELAAARSNAANEGQRDAPPDAESISARA